MNPLALASLIGGFLLLIFGGGWLVRGAVALAKSLGISTLLISLTVVAFGTSAPELAVNLIAALGDNSGINFGNIVGSNIANVGLVLAITALMAPVIVHRSVIQREIPFMLLATLATVGIIAEAFDPGVTRARLAWYDGVVLLLLFAVFLAYTVRTALKQRNNPDAFAEDVDAETKPLKLPMAALLTGAGLIGVIYGGDRVVYGAVTIAEDLGVNQTLIGLTIVAIGTSLPELVTCVIAVRHGHTDMAIGNIVGSNIWNLLLILGLSVTIGPFDLPAGGMLDVLVMAGLSLVILPLAIRQRNITRLEGGFLLSVYLGYMGYKIYGALA